jgi:hypothetical protein
MECLGLAELKNNVYFYSQALDEKLHISQSIESLYDSMKNIPWEKVSRVALTVILLSAGIYFANAYYLESHFSDFIYSTLSFGHGVQELTSLVVEEGQMKQSIIPHIAISFGAASVIIGIAFLIRGIITLNFLSFISGTTNILIGVQPFGRYTWYMQSRINKDDLAKKSKDAVQHAGSGSEDLGAASSINASLTINQKGFTNIGNTCFLNATLQMLLANPSFTRSLDRDLVKAEKEEDAHFEARKHFLDHLRILKNELSQKEPSREKINESLVEIRRKNPIILRQFSHTEDRFELVEIEKLKEYSKKDLFLSIQFPRDFLFSQKEEESLEVFEARKKCYEELFPACHDIKIPYERLLRQELIKEETLVNDLSSIFEIDQTAISFFHRTQERIPHLTSQEDAQEFFMIISEALCLEINPATSLLQVRNTVCDDGTIIEHTDKNPYSLINLKHTEVIEKTNTKVVLTAPDEFNLQTNPDERHYAFLKRRNLFSSLIEGKVSLERLKKEIPTLEEDPSHSIEEYFGLPEGSIRLESEIVHEEADCVTLERLLELYFTDEIDVLREDDEEIVVTKRAQLRHRDIRQLESIGFELPRFRQINNDVREKRKQRFTGLLEDQKIWIFDETQQKDVQVILRPLSIVRHIGSLHGGHYTAFIKEGDDWLHYDDAHVEKIETEELNQLAETDAYLVNFQVILEE